MCKFDPSERIQMCTVVDELSELAQMPLQKQTTERITRATPEVDVSAEALSVRKRMTHEQSVGGYLRPHSKIYQLHELLWSRIENTQAHFNGNKGKFWRVVDDAKSSSLSISAHPDSLLDFTQLAFQAYGLHRRLDKLMAAAFVDVDRNTPGGSLHDWKRRCYEILGVDSSDFIM